MEQCIHSFIRCNGRDDSSDHPEDHFNGQVESGKPNEMIRRWLLILLSLTACNNFVSFCSKNEVADWTDDVDDDTSLSRPPTFGEMQTKRTFSAILWFFFCCTSPPSHLSFDAKDLDFSKWGRGKSFLWPIGCWWFCSVGSDCADFLQFVHSKMTLLSFPDLIYLLLFVWNCIIAILFDPIHVFEMQTFVE